MVSEQAICTRTLQSETIVTCTSLIICQIQGTYICLRPSLRNFACIQGLVKEMCTYMAKFTFKVLSYFWASECSSSGPKVLEGIKSFRNLITPSFHTTVFFINEAVLSSKGTWLCSFLLNTS